MLNKLKKIVASVMAVASQTKQNIQLLLSNNEIKFQI